jgi:RsiW-degrading membrane proteinase PrsW (M82 family)/Zn-finger nucleic acid-binding protein
MNTQSILIILLATIVGYIYLLIARSYDIYEKEPIGKLVLVTVLGGVVSVFVSLFLYRFVHVEYNFLDAIIKIGLIEELSKLLALMLLVQFIKKDFNEIVDGIIYITAVALGFSVIENILYAFSSETPFLLLFQRSFFSTLGHISFSGYLGIAYYIHVRVHRNYLGILLALILASVAHGFYDGVIFHPELGFLFKFVFAGLVILQLIMLRMTLGFSKFRKVFSADIFTQTDNKAFLYCPQCDKSIKTNELSFWKIKAGECETCKDIVMNEGNIKKTLRYFRPVVSMPRFFNAYKNSTSVAAVDADSKILYSVNRKMLGGDPTAMGVWFALKNEEDRTRILKIPILGAALKYIGLRYMAK